MGSRGVPVVNVVTSQAFLVMCTTSQCRSESSDSLLLLSRVLSWSLHRAPPGSSAGLLIPLTAAVLPHSPRLVPQSQCPLPALPSLPFCAKVHLLLQTIADSCVRSGKGKQARHGLSLVGVERQTVEQSAGLLVGTIGNIGHLRSTKSSIV
ncbi:hypothetical protein DMC30DRAFT_200141 [Rhodotorula diobovata]|uniref:Uncharacterized protein n=1 Tax=Rhodotorula diobovata TaxID=5288 RepID=A0A5C5FWX0_9BASI|nr:hypothetical protein DMC30DRAFT_200141 [Rhodotorula diobovata]